MKKKKDKKKEGKAFERGGTYWAELGGGQFEKARITVHSR